MDPAEYVLTGFHEEERELAAASVERAAEAALDLLKGAESGSA
jgi:peptidyl-tRNA hydrolase